MIGVHPEDQAVAHAKAAFSAAELAVTAASSAVDRARDAANDGGDRSAVLRAKRLLAESLDAQEDARSAVRVAERKAETAADARRAAASLSLGERARRLDKLNAESVAALRYTVQTFLNDLARLDDVAKGLDNEAGLLNNEAAFAGVRVRASRVLVPSTLVRDFGATYASAQRFLANWPDSSKETR